MVDLKEQVRNSAGDLQNMWTRLSAGLGSTFLPNECYTRWKELAFHHKALLETIPLFEIRDKAWLIVKSLVDQERIENEQKRQQAAKYGPEKPSHNFSHDGIDMNFASARHLALVAYTSVSWSIYDRFANICGRLAATEMVQRHEKQNPKLVEDFLTKEKDRSDVLPLSEKKEHPHGRGEYGHQLFAFSMQFHLVAAYDWPTRVIYTIRNWLVHEGQSIGSVRLFHGDRIEDGLRLHADAILHVEKMCRIALDSNGDPKKCCLRGQANPWRNGQDKDLLTILACYHAEADTMLAGLLKWSVDSFVGQLVTFSARDKAALSAVAVQNPQNMRS